MIYLIEDRDYLKIGYTSNLQQRITSYKVENCYCKLIDSKPGTRNDEAALHELCKEGGYQGEGFKNVPEVKEIGKSYTSKFPEFKIIQARNQKIIDLIYEYRSLDNKEMLLKLKSIQYKQTAQGDKSLQMIANECDNEEFKQILKDYKAINDLIFHIEHDTHRHFSYDFKKFQVDIDGEPNDKTSGIKVTKSTGIIE